MMKRTRAKSSRRGSAIVLGLMMTVGMLVLTYSVFRMAGSVSNRLEGGLDDRRALLLAESGLHDAYEAIRLGGTGGMGSIADPAYLGGGVVWVDATDLGGNRTQLVATGMSGSGRRALQAVVEFSGGPAPLFETTLNSREQLTLNSNVMIDSYDSSKGDYASQAVNFSNTHTHADQNGDVRSNAGVVLNSYATVFGDAVPGPGFSVTFNNGSVVTGTTTPASNGFTFPPIVVPDLPDVPDVVVPDLTSITVPPGDYEMSSISVGKGATLTIQGPTTIVVDDFNGGKDGNLLIDATNGPVEIIVEKAYTHISGFEADAVPGSPMALAFKVLGSNDVVFPSNTAIRGAYYLPDANIVFSSANECWGAFAANRIDMSNDMKFHYDENLLEHFKEDTGQGNDGLDVLAWSELQVQPTSLLADRRDPVQVLGLNRAALRTPHAALEGLP